MKHNAYEIMKEMWSIDEEIQKLTSDLKKTEQITLQDKNLWIQTLYLSYRFNGWTIPRDHEFAEGFNSSPFRIHELCDFKSNLSLCDQDRFRSAIFFRIIQKILWCLPHRAKSQDQPFGTNCL